MDSLKIFVCISLSLFSLLAFASFAEAAYGPRAYMTEYVAQDYWWNGSAKAADIRRGQVEVSVPNPDDVLQYVRVGTTTTGTNIDGYFLDNVVTSYNTADKKDPIYANLTGNVQATYYNITNVTVAPTINMSLTVSNLAGGSDIYDSDNIGTGGATNNLLFTWTITNPSADRTIPGVTAILQFNTSAGPSGGDAVNITLGTNTTTGSGTTTSSISNTDADTDYDRYTWTGTLAAGASIVIAFNATLLEGGNIFNGDNYINLDGPSDKAAAANVSQATTLSGNTINYKLARGSIRQGVDLQISNNIWYARGFIKNTATTTPSSGQALTYNVTDWGIYEVIAATGQPYPGTGNMSGKFNTTATSSYLTPSDGSATYGIYTTDSARSSNTSWYYAGASKPYIATYFNWYVCWNDTGADNYVGYINTTMDAQTLYKVDFANTNTYDGVIYPDTGGQTIIIRDNATYTGYLNSPTLLSVGKIEMYSIVPANTSTNTAHGTFSITASSVEVYYVNATGMWRLEGDGNVNWSVTQPAYYGLNGTVYVRINDLSSAKIWGTTGTVGRNISAATDKIALVYSVVSNVSMTTGDIYIFTGNTTFNTTTGTKDTEAHTATSKTVTVSSKRLIGYKDLFAQYASTPTKINVTLYVTVEASTGEYISGIKFIDYVVNGTFSNNAKTYADNLTVRFNNGTWYTWDNGTGYRVTWNGTRQLTDGTWVEVFEFTNVTGPAGGYNLTNGNIIEIKYVMDVWNSGTYILPLQIAAFDPATGESFSAESYGVIRVDVPFKAVPLQITDHTLELAKRVLVGTPAMWIKNFDVFNPNSRMISSEFKTEIYGDALEAFVSYYNERGEKVEEAVALGDPANGKRGMSWSSTLGPLESRTYEIRVLTPPVLEIDRDIEVLDKLEGKMVKLKMDIFLKSFGEEAYKNVVLNLPIGYENIIEVRDGFGRQLQFTGGKDSSSIVVDEIEPAGMKTVSVVYKASYPTIIITPDRDRYDLNSPVSLEILVINGGETVDYPYMEVEIYTPGMDVIYTNMERLNTLEPLEKTQIYEKFVVPVDAPGGMYMASAKFREDYKVLASGTGNFLVIGPSGSASEALQIVAVLSVTCVLVYFSAKRLREVRRTKALLDSTGTLRKQN